MCNVIHKNNLKIAHVIFKLKRLKYMHNTGHYLIPVLFFGSVSVTWWNMWKTHRFRKHCWYFILFYFMMLSVSSHSEWWIVKNLEVNSGDLIEVLYQHWLERTGKNHRKPQSEYPMHCSRFELSAYQIKSIECYHQSNLFGFSSVSFKTQMD
jgi:hypothetical protein